MVKDIMFSPGLEIQYLSYPWKTPDVFWWVTGPEQYQADRKFTLARMKCF